MAKAKLLEEGRILGTCEWCGDANVNLYADTKLCDDCDENCVRCSVCKELQQADDHCRHVFRDRNYEWAGSGYHPNPGLRKPLFRLFDLMPAGFAVDLRRAIKSGKFHTWAMLPLIGGGGTLELAGMPDRALPRETAQYLPYWWGSFLMDIGQGEQAEETADGYHWLGSLYERKTLAANRTTIGWIDEYIAERTMRPPSELDKLVDAVLAYRPKPKTKAQKKRARKKAKRASH